MGDAVRGTRAHSSRFGVSDRVLWLLPAMDDSPSMWMPGGVLIAVVRACASF
jgi:hypothetical protein